MYNPLHLYLLIMTTALVYLLLFCLYPFHVPDRPTTGIFNQREESFANSSVTIVTGTTEQQNISLHSSTPSKAKVKMLSVGVVT